MAENVKTHANDAAQAHTNLTMFHAVMQLMEGGVLYGASPQGSAAKIIRICKDEAAKQLRLFDAAMAKVERSQ
jgi:hypothetical protein